MAEVISAVDESTADAIEPKAEVDEATAAEIIADEQEANATEVKAVLDEPVADPTQAKSSEDEPTTGAAAKIGENETTIAAAETIVDNPASAEAEKTPEEGKTVDSTEGHTDSVEDEATEATAEPGTRKQVKIIDDGTKESEDNVKTKKKKHLDRSSVLDTRYDAELHDEMASSSSSSSSSDDDNISIASYIYQQRLPSVHDFFYQLGELPDLSVISLSISGEGDNYHMSIKDKFSIHESGVVDLGKFVDPLTGGHIDSSSEPITSTEPEIEEKEVEEEEEQPIIVIEHIVSEEDEQLLALDEADEDKEIKEEVASQRDYDEAFQKFIEMDVVKQVKTKDDSDYEALDRKAVVHQLRLTTDEFLNELIARIVNTCEYINPKSLLRKNLDKIRLMEELQTKLVDIDVEQKARLFLNRKTVEYFRRKKAFRSITDDNPESITADIEKYRVIICNLDRMLGREEATKQMTDLKIHSLKAELSDMEDKAKEELEIFQELVRKTLLRENFEKLRIVVENQLSKMELMRKEISDVRLVLIQRQHTLATLMETTKKLENLGDGLRMRDFENLHTDTIALDKKIEERNNELTRLRLRCNANLHIMAHMKEKQHMLRNANSLQRAALDELISESKSCREFLYELKLNRGRIRGKIRELSYQGGLLDKPALMLDYDNTVDRLEKLRSKVEQMRTKFTDTQLKIQAIEGRCSSVLS